MLLMCKVLYAKINSVSHASKISFRLRPELEIMIVLDGKVCCLGEVCMKCYVIQGKRELEKTSRGK